MSTPVTSSPSAPRTDIQGLRALAVSLVLAYHLFPTRLTGGFIGVDVFFVISGFLITLHLLTKIPTGPRDLVEFYSRRVRRLLPASLLVLAVTLVASRLFAPETQWANTARQARAAVLYVINWLLASDAVDYLAAENPPSPVQHFWSLAVEEQFYFVWPVLILAVAALARKVLRRDNVVPVVLVALVGVVAASLAYSIHITGANPQAAYFVTPARVWELGIGGVLAALTLLLTGTLRPRYAVPLAWLGFAMIAWSAVTYSTTTPFPGWEAGIPVLGTAFVIGAASTVGAGSPGPLMALRPIQWLGDVSYSVYLWHWPLVVILPQALGHDLTLLDKVCIVVATLTLAAVTKALVEDRFRGAVWAVPMPKPFAIAGLAMAVLVVGTVVQLHEVDRRAERAQQALTRGLGGGDPCFGAAALTAGASCPQTPYAKLAPAPIEAASDKSAAYEKQRNGRDCWAYQPRFPIKECTFGRRESPKNVVLVGNSHAGQWLPALQRLADRDDFKVTTLLASRCAMSRVRQQFDTTEFSTACLNWVDNVTEEVARLKPDLVVMTNRISVPAEGRTLEESQALYDEGYRAVLTRWESAGIPVLVLHDTPAPGFGVPDCIATEREAYAKCDGTRDAWVPEDPAAHSVEAVGDPDIRFVDLTDHICGPTICRAVNGGVITYFDGSHLTATYSATLAESLGPPVRALLGHGQAS